MKSLTESAVSAAANAVNPNAVARLGRCIACVALMVLLGLARPPRHSWSSRSSALAGWTGITSVADSHVGPNTLVINKGGSYVGGTYSNVVVNIPPTDDTPVLINGLRLVGPGTLISVERANQITIADCTGATPPPGYFLLAWDVTAIVVEHNAMNGTAGVMISGARGRVKSVSACFNTGRNITAANGSAQKTKTSFIQLQYVHCPNVEMAWNQVTNEPGRSAVEDNLSLMCAGGTPGRPALIHDNFVDGGFAFPSASHYSGSGIMAFDPGAGAKVSCGGYVRVFDNQVLRLENQAIVAAGGHDIEIANNRAVNDGSSTAVVTVGYQVFNWGGKTPAAMFGNISVRGNFSSWKMKDGRRSDFAFDRRTSASRNGAGESTETAERAAWAAKLVANNITLGPRSSDAWAAYASCR